MIRDSGERFDPAGVGDELDGGAKEVKTLLDTVSLQFAKFATQAIGWCVNLMIGVEHSCN